MDFFFSRQIVILEEGGSIVIPYRVFTAVFCRNVNVKQDYTWTNFDIKRDNVRLVGVNIHQMRPTVQVLQVEQEGTLDLSLAPFILGAFILFNL